MRQVPRQAAIAPAGQPAPNGDVPAAQTAQATPEDGGNEQQESHKAGDAEVHTRSQVGVVGMGHVPDAADYLGIDVVGP